MNAQRQYTQSFESFKTGKKEEDRFGQALAMALCLHSLLLFIKITMAKVEDKEEEKKEPVKIQLISSAKPEVPKVAPPVVKAVGEGSADFKMDNTPKAGIRKNPHHTSASAASPKYGKSKNPGPVAENLGPQTSKQRAYNEANRVAHDSKGPGGPGKVGGDTGGKGQGGSYKGLGFETAIGGLLSKSSGTAKSARMANGGGGGGYGFKDGSLYGSGIERIAGTSDGKALKVAGISGNGVGDLSDAAAGKLDGKVGAAGLVSKKGVVMAAIPSGSTFVTGGMDPEAIRRALLDYLAQFRYCYQKQLDRADRAEEGIMDLKFYINENGRAVNSKAIPRGFSNSDVSSCSVGVLEGIQFPKPPHSGAVIEVNQPLNFNARTL